VEVPHHLLRLAHVLHEESHEVLIEDPRPIELHRRDLEALLVDLASGEAVLGAADVGDVADGAEERDDVAVAEHRGDQGDVEKVAGADPGVVGDQDVPGL